MIASEGVPFAKTGGLADVVGALPLALEQLGHEVVLILPKYKGLTKRKTTLGSRIAVYLIQHDGFFGREHLYGGKDGDYPDNLERFSFFSWRALEQLRELKFQPDVIHIHDWQTALVPVYLATTYRHEPTFAHATTILTVHNLSYQGIFPKGEFPKLGLPWELFHMEGLEYYDQINLLKGGLVFAKRINTVSPTYAREIQVPEYGCGLEGVLRRRANDLTGILNAIDTAAWDPGGDKALAAPFTIKTLARRAMNKRALQAAMKLPVDPKAPLVGMVTRLAAQKGIDLVAAAAAHLVRMGAQLVILGTGDRPYHVQLDTLARKHQQSVRVRLAFDEPLAHQIYGGADLFLMPSRFEPCGLGQMIAMRYGAIPVVRRTGGLADTVIEADRPDGNGFLFGAADAAELSAAVRRALVVFKTPAAWQALQRRAMAVDWSWARAAKAYVEWYSPAERSVPI